MKFLKMVHVTKKSSHFYKKVMFYAKNTDQKARCKEKNKTKIATKMIETRNNTTPLEMALTIRRESQNINGSSHTAH